MQTTETQDTLPRATAKMARFIGAIVRSATISATPAGQAAIPCRKDRGSNKCSGFIKVQRQDIPTQQVNWSCNRCVEGGTISGWKESHNNLTEFAESLAPSANDLCEYEWSFICTSQSIQVPTAIKSSR